MPNFGWAAALCCLVLSLFLSACCGGSEPPGSTDNGSGDPAETEPQDTDPGDEEDTDTTPPVISEITATEITATSAKITWTTNEEATGQVEWGTTDGYGSDTSSGLGTSHSVVLTALIPEITYHYRVRAEDEAHKVSSWSRDETFTTRKETEFNVFGLDVDPPEADFWEDVTVSVQVENIGEIKGTYTAILKINGTEVQTRQVVVAVGETETVTFTIVSDIEDVGSVYDIEIDGESATLKIKELEPIYNIGDKWISKMIFNSKGFTSTYEEVTTEVTGEADVDGNHCYVLHMSSDDPELGGTLYIDKMIMLPISVGMSGKYMGISFTADVSCSYEFLKGFPYPMVVGKKFKIKETVTTTTNIFGTETETGTYTYRVESLEEIEVQAGTLECFKMVKYDEDDEVVSTTWISENAKSWLVKQKGEEAWKYSELLDQNVP